MGEESLLPNTFSCARLKYLDRKFTKQAAEKYNPTLKREYIPLFLLRRSR